MKFLQLNKAMKTMWKTSGKQHTIDWVAGFANAQDQLCGFKKIMT